MFSLRFRDESSGKRSWNFPSLVFHFPDLWLGVQAGELLRGCRPEDGPQRFRGLMISGHGRQMKLWPRAADVEVALEPRNEDGGGEKRMNLCKRENSAQTWAIL